MMRRWAVAVVVAGLLLVGAGCSSAPPVAVEPGDGPAATVEPVSVPSEPVEGEPSSSQPARVANFGDKYTYDDGLEVEIIRIQNGRFTAKDVEYGGYDGEKKGDPWTKFTLRVRNGTDTTIELAAGAVVSYGPDGTEAIKSSLLDQDNGLFGKLIPGKSRSAVGVYLIPTKYYDDVVMEVTTDYDHESVIFSGSIR